MTKDDIVAEVSASLGSDGGSDSKDEEPVLAQHVQWVSTRGWAATHLHATGSTGKYGPACHDLFTNSVYPVSPRGYVPIAMSVNNLSEYSIITTLTTTGMIVNKVIRVHVR